MIQEYERLLDGLIARWHARGLFESADTDLPFGERLIRVVLEA